jgi:hypothetical protein
LTQGTLNKTIFVHLLDDNIPEEKEVYQIILFDVWTQGKSELNFELLFCIFFSENRATIVAISVFNN